jgi:hypothetical protein
VNRRRGLVKSGDKGRKLEAIADRLRDAEEKNDLGQANDARALLDQAEKSLDDFRKAEAAAQDQARGRRLQLKTQLASYRQSRDPLSPEETDFLQTADRKLAGAEELLSAEAVDGATEVLDEVQAGFDSIRASTLDKQVADLREKLRVLKVADAKKAEKDAAGREPDEIEALIKQKKFDDAWQRTNELAAKLVSLRDPAPRLPGPPALLKPAYRPTTPALQTRIVVAGPPETRTTDTPLGFRIDDAQRLLRDGDEYRWYFEPGHTATTEAPRASHQFSEEGGYSVKVEVWRGTNREFAMQLSESVTVLPGRTRREVMGVERAVLMTDLALTIVALILACLTGVLYLYVNKPFGSLADYLGAILWGFGIDSGVRGFTAVFKRISTQGA